MVVLNGGILALPDRGAIVGTRMDVPYRPNLRLGFGESVLMQGVPYSNAGVEWNRRAVAGLSQQC